MKHHFTQLLGVLLLCCLFLPLSAQRNCRITGQKSFVWDKENFAWQNRFKSQYIINDFGIQTGTVSSIWDTLNNQWQGYFRTTSTYDPQTNRLIQQDNERFDPDQGIWEADRRLVLAYDSIGRLVERESWVGNPLDRTTFIRFEREQYVYDDRFRIVEVFIDLWDSGLIDWRPSKKRENEFQEDPRKDIYTEFFYYQPEAEYRPLRRTTNCFTPAGQLELELFERHTGTDWENERQKRYTYDAQNRTTEILTQVWDDQWVNQLRTVYRYNPNGLLTEYEEQSWDVATQKWIPTDLYRSGYDQNGLPVSFERLVYDADKGEFVPVWIRRQKIDPDGYPLGYEFSAWNPQTETYELLQSTLLSWDCEGGGESFVTSQLKIFPNPAIGTTFLDTWDFVGKNAELDIFDASGRRVFKRSFACTNTIEPLNLSSFPGGIYLIRLRVDDEIFQEKLILR
ncbi:MAG: T9SS type A sorting domain-containing protein [Bacteroidota bacterium]